MMTKQNLNPKTLFHNFLYFIHAMSVHEYNITAPLILKLLLENKMYVIG